MQIAVTIWETWRRHIFKRLWWKGVNVKRMFNKIINL